MEVAISTNHRIHLSAEQAVFECYPLGFTEIELGTPHYSADLTVLNMLRQKLGLNYSVHAPFLASKGFIADAAAVDEKVFEESKELFLDTLDNARTLGAKRIVFHITEPKIKGSIDRAIEMFLLLSKKASENNQLVCIENKMPNSELGYSFADIKEIIDEVGSKNLGLCFDTGHAIASAGSEKKALELMDSLKEYIREVHIVPGSDEWDIHTPPQIEPHLYRGIIGMLDEIGYEGNLVIEALNEIPDNEIVNGARYLRATIAEHYENKLF